MKSDAKLVYFTRWDVLAPLVDVVEIGVPTAPDEGVEAGPGDRGS
jgi:hypothetical protein